MSIAAINIQLPDSCVIFLNHNQAYATSIRRNAWIENIARSFPYLLRTGTIGSTDEDRVEIHVNQRAPIRKPTSVGDHLVADFGRRAAEDRYGPDGAAKVLIV